MLYTPVQKQYYLTLSDWQNVKHVQWFKTFWFFFVRDCSAKSIVVTRKPTKPSGGIHYEFDVFGLVRYRSCRRAVFTYPGVNHHIRFRWTCRARRSARRRRNVIRRLQFSSENRQRRRRRTCNHISFSVRRRRHDIITMRTAKREMIFPSNPSRPRCTRWLRRCSGGGGSLKVFGVSHCRTYAGNTRRARGSFGRYVFAAQGPGAISVRA